MSVVLYKPGNSHTVRGIRCSILICDEHSFLQNLDNGWFSSPEECYAEEKESDEEKAKKEADEKAEVERQLLLEKAQGYGLSPHPKTGIPKLNIMIDDSIALQDITADAVGFGIDVGEGLGYDEIKALIDELKEQEDAE